MITYAKFSSSRYLSLARKTQLAKLKANNIQGVIIKIGEYTHLDEMFISHVNNAVTYNLPYGIYYYAHASTIDKAIAEANWVDKQNQNISQWTKSTTWHLV